LKVKCLFCPSTKIPFLLHPSFIQLLSTKIGNLKEKNGEEGEHILSSLEEEKINVEEEEDKHIFENIN